MSARRLSKPPGFKQTDLIAIFGRRGSGKTTLCKRVQQAYPRVVIIDLLHEYSRSDCDYLVSTLEGFDRALLELHQSNPPAFRLVYQFDIENSADETDTFNQIMRLLYYFGNCMVVVEEIHHYMKNEHLPEWLRKAILVGRHRNLGILATSQRPATVSKTFVSQCAHVFCGTLFEKNDLKYFHDTIGDCADQLAAVPPFHFLHYQPGQLPRIVKNSA